MTIDGDAHPIAEADATIERLFVYGSLQPGGPNEHVLASVIGDWQPAVLKGRLSDSGWGAGLGYPGLLIDAAGDDVSGYVLRSSSLGEILPELDRFEGDEYERVAAAVTLDSGERVQAYVYTLRSRLD